MKYTNENIDSLFTYHNPSGIDPMRFEKIREAAKELGRMIVENGGNEFDEDLAIQKLRECVYYAVASIVVPKIQ